MSAFASNTIPVQCHLETSSGERGAIQPVVDQVLTDKLDSFEFVIQSSKQTLKDQSIVYKLELSISKPLFLEGTMTKVKVATSGSFYLGKAEESFERRPAQELKIGENLARIYCD